MTHSQRSQIISLFNHGDTFPVIGKKVGADRKLISKTLAQAGISTRGNTFTLLHDPSGTFSPGDAAFDQGNMIGTLWFNAWVPGMEFLERSTRARWVVESWVHESTKTPPTERQMLVSEGRVLRPANVHSWRKINEE